MITNDDTEDQSKYGTGEIIDDNMADREIRDTVELGTDFVDIMSKWDNLQISNSLLRTPPDAARNRPKPTSIRRIQELRQETRSSPPQMKPSSASRKLEYEHNFIPIRTSPKKMNGDIPVEVGQLGTFDLAACRNPFLIDFFEDRPCCYRPQTPTPCLQREALCISPTETMFSGSPPDVVKSASTLGLRSIKMSLERSLTETIGSGSPPDGVKSASTLGPRSTPSIKRSLERSPMESKGSGSPPDGVKRPRNAPLERSTSQEPISEVKRETRKRSYSSSSEPPEIRGKHRKDE